MSHTDFGRCISFGHPKAPYVIKLQNMVAGRFAIRVYCNVDCMVLTAGLVSKSGVLLLPTKTVVITRDEATKN